MIRGPVCVLLLSTASLVLAASSKECCKDKGPRYDPRQYDETYEIEEDDHLEEGTNPRSYHVAYEVDKHAIDGHVDDYADEHADGDDHDDGHADDHAVHKGGHDDGDGFSYYTYTGPVSGPVTEVQVPPGADYNPLAPQTNNRVDYQAEPDYAYHYGVHDPKSDNSHTHQESRSGSNVQGEYRVMQPDGVVRIVRYTSDPKSGFKATVEYAVV